MRSFIIVGRCGYSTHKKNKRHYFGANFFLKMLLEEIFDLYTTYITLVMFLVIFSQKLQLQKQEI